MTDPLAAELDRLFQLPPAELVEARNALADQLRRAGDKAGAARIKAVKRAAPAAWALNQVHFAQPAVLERARELANELRELQTQRGVDPKRLAAAVERQRSAAQAVVDAALRAGRSAGLSDAALQQRKLFTTVQAWLAGAGDEAPGRMTQELEASGFDAFAGMTLSAAPPVIAAEPAVSEPEGTSPARPTSDRKALERAAKVLAEREQAAAAASERVHARSGEHAAAREQRDLAQQSVRVAERRLVELRSALDQRERELQRRGSALEQSQREQASADEAAATARAELAAQQSELDR